MYFTRYGLWSEVFAKDLRILSSLAKAWKLQTAAIFFCLLFALSVCPDKIWAKADPAAQKLAKSLYYGMTLRKAKIPPLPSGLIRIWAPLNSLSGTKGELYYPDTPGGSQSNANTSYCDWTKSRFAIMGNKVSKHKLEGNLWFFADIDPKIRKIINVTVYGIGYCFPRYSTAFMLWKEIDDSFGEIGADRFTIKASGKGISEDIRDHSGLEVYNNFGIIITGEGDLLKARNGNRIPLKFYFHSQKNLLKASDSHQNIDRGTGIGIIERKDEPEEYWEASYPEQDLPDQDMFRNRAEPSDAAGTVETTAPEHPEEQKSPEQIPAQENANGANVEKQPEPTTRQQKKEQAGHVPASIGSPAGISSGQKTSEQAPVQEMPEANGKQNKPYTIILD